MQGNQYCTKFQHSLQSNKPVFNDDRNMKYHQPLYEFYPDVTIRAPKRPMLTKASEEEVVNELLRILVDCFKEIGSKSRMLLLRKFFSELKEEIPMQTLILERLGNSRVQAILDSIQKVPESFRSREDLDTEIAQRNLKMKNTTIQSRSLHVGRDSLRKIERFKIRTVDFGEVVNAEEDRQ